jgi:putative ABC transport system substrate-binding protein
LAPAWAGEALPVIGWLMLETEQASHTDGDAFLEGLRDLGYVEGRNFLLEVRWADDRGQLPAMAAELVARKVSVIVALQPPCVIAAMRATTTIPIVMRSSADPVRSGWVQSLSRPGGNVTGVSTYYQDLFGKRAELLKDLVPGLTHLALLMDSSSLLGSDFLKEGLTAAETLELKVTVVEVKSKDELPGAFAEAVRAGAQGLIPLRSPMTTSQTRQIADLARQHRLPAIYDVIDFKDASGLISYGIDYAALYRRMAYYVKRILEGAKPADLPVELPTVFQLVVNLKEARAIGLRVPDSILVRADQVIQ